MQHPRSATALALIAVLALGACGDPDTASPGTDPVPATTVGTTSVPDDLGGSGLPVAAPGEFPETWAARMAGELALDDRGCWFLDAPYGRGLLVFPPGFALAASGSDVVSSDGTLLANAQPVDIVGSIVFDAAELPGGPDGKWATHASFCGTADGVVVASVLDTAFMPTSAEATALAATMDGAEFAVDWPCGHGFATSSSDERFGLTISPRGDPPASGPVSLPDERFEAHLTVGSNLFVNHCDDVAEWFEPARQEVATFEIVSGDFQFPEVGDEMCSGNGPSTITVTDLVVELPTGEVTFGPIEITNEAPGCFAG